MPRPSEGRAASNASDASAAVGPAGPADPAGPAAHLAAHSAEEGASAEDPASLVDQCLLVGMPGRWPDPDFQLWLEAGLGGVLLFRDNIVDQSQLAELVTELRRLRPGIIVAADEEGGDVTRLHARAGSPYPGNLALGAVDDTTLTRAVAADIGTELDAVGVHLNLAPVADVHTDPNNPIIGTRSFSDDPELVARHTAAYVDGLHDAGVFACAKHFPGHGDTHLDSHHDLPTVTGDLAPHLRPFRAAIDAGADAVLTAHIVFPELDERPATLSPRVLSGLLRDRLGFDGVIITDSMSMGAIADHIGLAEGALQALLAGADLICMNSAPQEQLAVRRHLAAAAEDGRLPLTRLRAAAGRVRRLTMPPPRRQSAAACRWDSATARSALWVGGVHLPLTDPPFVIEVAAPRRGVELSAASLLAHIRAREPEAAGVRLHTPEPDQPADLDGAIAAAAGRPLVLVVRDAHRDPGQRDIVARTLAARPDAVLVGIGTTADAKLASAGYVGTRGGARVNLATAADALVGTASSKRCDVCTPR